MPSLACAAWADEAAGSIFRPDHQRHRVVAQEAGRD
eukprot:CAMPEP_0175732174 /NCGR_PEP_ID=MMETSP0097-20121207/51225_1 /TAXON_ID=311494 /ORGANISM="Alexandrium monilatum, Strain CCMP3105" /LENGTH=35 /DNA_ID= /DNA_START= /DNA_END= /DNA_ORIENTATION=